MSSCRLRIVLAALLMASVAFGQDRLPDWGSVRREVPASIRLPDARYQVVRAWEAEEAPANVGRVVSDAQAYGGKAREGRTSLRRAQNDVEGHLLFGPYIEVPPGTYAAFFRVKLLDDSRDGEVVAEIDACVGHGQTILTARDIVDTDLTAGRYVQVPLFFRYEGGKLECRLRWRAYASLRVDRVTLVRAEGVNAMVGIPRVPEPKPSGEPKDLPYTPPPALKEIFARAKPPADTLLVADIRPLSTDWQMMLLCLQGLVNRERPRLYVLFNETDEHWLNWMRQRGWVKRVERVNDATTLVQRFRSAFRGLVVTDPTVPATRNVATMLAGTRGLLPVSPRLARQLRLPVVEDLRGRWKRNVDAYRWAFETLWNEMNHHMVACSYPDHLALRDYLVANKIFIFWVSGAIDGARPYSDPDAEARLAEQILAKMPPNTCVLSYPWAGKDVGMGEGPGVTLFAEFGKYLVGTINCSNLTVHSGIDLPELRQKPAPPAPPLRDDKVYITLIMSDGDNLPVLTIHNFPQLWRDPQRGSLPIGWTISPAARLLIPDVVDYYYTTSSPNDCWLTAVSGLGYTYPDHFGKRYRPEERERVYTDFLHLTNEAMGPMDLHMAWIMGITDPRKIDQYLQEVPRVQALFPDYGKRVTRYEDASYLGARNVPVFHAVMGWRDPATREEQLAFWEQQVREMTPRQRPAFLHVFIWNWGADIPMLKELLDRLGDDYVPVRPDHLAELYRQAVEREVLLVRAPERAASLAEQPVVIPLTIRNASREAQSVRVRVAEGLRDARLSAEAVELPVAGGAEVQITGVPDADAVTVSLEGSFGKREVRVPVLRIARAAIIGEIPPVERLEPVAVWEAEDLGHRSGEKVNDSSASGGTAWRAEPGKAESGYIVYGPYAGMSPGRYVALFRVKRLGEAQGDLLKVDTCVGGGNPITAERRVRAEELPVGEYRYVALMVDHPGGAIETRVEWFGRAGVMVDHIALWRVR